MAALSDGKPGQPLVKPLAMRYNASNTVAIQRPNLGIQFFGGFLPNSRKGRRQPTLPRQAGQVRKPNLL